MLTYCQLDPKEQTSMKFEWNTKPFIHESVFATVVCEMVAICPGRDAYKHEAGEWRDGNDNGIW